MGGIFVGGLFATVLAVIVLPRSANIEALRDARKALKLLMDLNAMVSK